MAQARRRVFYSGRVQGVGFRATARQLAGGFAVAGTVRNLDDGRVELVVQGDAVEVDGLLAAIDRAFLGKIRDASVLDEPVAEGSPPGVVIRYD